MNLRKIARGQAGAGLLVVLLSGLAFSAPNTRAQVAALLEQLAKSPVAQRVAVDSIAKAKAALERADHLRSSGDQRHGAMLEETALEWAQTSELLDKTARAEQSLAELQTRTTELETKVFRAQALVEQSVARRARAEEALHKLDEKGAKP